MDFKDKLIDLTYLEQSFGTEMIPEMLALYKSQVPEFTEGIQTHFKNQNWLELSRIAHKAKGSWVIVGNKKYSHMFRNFQLVCEVMHLHVLQNIQKERTFSEQEAKLYEDIKKRGLGEDSDLDPETARILSEELERFIKGENLVIVPAYTELSLQILKNSIPEVDELLANF